MNLTPLEARQVIRHLKAGVFPPLGIDQFTFGRRAEVATIQEALDTAVAGRSKGIFLEADYGHGKSHMLKFIEYSALAQGFAVSWIILDVKNHAFNHPARYLHSFLENIKVAETPLRGLCNLVPFWMNNGQKQSLLKYADSGAPSWFGNAILGQANGYSISDPDHYYSRALEARDIKYRSGWSSHQGVYDRMKSLAQLCRAAGLKGVVFLFDEIESVAVLYNRLSRTAAYSVLSTLLDPDEFPHFCFFFAATPDFRSKLKSEEEAYIYSPSAASFIKKWINGKHCVLPLPRLSKSQNGELLRKLRSLHEHAFTWKAADRVTDELIAEIVQVAHNQSLTERELIKSFVTILEICQQNPDYRPVITSEEG